MTTLSGSLSAYLQSAWTLLSPVAASDIHWNDDWFNSKHPDNPQITITDLVSPVLRRFDTGGSLDFKYRPLYVVNVWQQIRAGGPGTQEAQNMQDMRLHIAQLLREGIYNGYGGSLTPFAVVLPRDAGLPRHELDKTPRMLRYELTLITTTDNEP